MAPEPPASPEFADTMVKAPDEVAVPSPLDRNIAPPVCTVDLPEWATTGPPTPLVPLPTVTETCPPAPVVAAPEPNVTSPLLPPLDVPEAKVMAPDPPAAPELAGLDGQSTRRSKSVCLTTRQEHDTRRDGDITTVAAFGRPACTLSVGRRHCHQHHLCVNAATRPPEPVVAAPDPMLTPPLLPPFDVPEENDIHPPAAPEFADLMVRAPDEVAVPSPEDINITPPVCTVERPECATTWPPTPLVPLPTVTLPPMPVVAAPDPMLTSPLLPPFDVPDENDIAPDPPAAPALADLIISAPDEVAVP